VPQHHLDDAVFPAVDSLREEGLEPPHALLLAGTGLGMLTSAITELRSVDLADLPGVPAIWQEGLLYSGRLGACSIWMLEDAPGDLEFGEGGGPERPAWERSWPVWLGASGGAQVMLHTAAGVALDAAGEREALQPGQLAALSDHINLSGQTPLLGLGETRLGPLFPDQSQLHHAGLRSRALAHGSRLGIRIAEAQAACLVGPSLATPAELRWLASTGSHVAVQGLAAPLIAAAHAGLSTLALVAVADSASRPLRMAELVQGADACAPAIEDLIKALAPDVAEVAAELEFEA
jgi:purine-nucleoside phosphorylase